ncbi:hypothetical protein ANN_23562 [Periplaneta americana]|uniref:Reverse transcriptase domain-containing protein n=1 Tax=Periplaneta americana TaxID=6978 RepID=A0ABQ8SMM3_PERAM|nr:hypothetical protein ANN_23562 [Periplaneta americana]
MSPGSSTESYPAFARIELRENPGKNLKQVTCPDGDSNPGHLISRPDVLTFTPQEWTVSVTSQYGDKSIMHIKAMDKMALDMAVVGKKSYGHKVTVDEIVRAFENHFGSDKLYKLLGENPQTIRENTEILFEASKEIGLEVNPEKTKYMIMSRDQNIVRNGTIKVGDLSFEEVEKFKYLGATVTNINDTREEIKRRINMGNACYYSVEKLLSSSLLSKNLKVRIYKTVILPVVLYGCETWTLTLREEQRLRVFENKVLRKIFGAKRDEVTDASN